jgi:hypothetical protein
MTIPSDAEIEAAARAIASSEDARGSRWDEPLGEDEHEWRDWWRTVARRALVAAARVRDPEPEEMARLREALAERRHMIEFRDDGWTVAHPLHERLDLETLFDCRLPVVREDGGLRGRFWMDADGTITGAAEKD